MGTPPVASYVLWHHVILWNFSYFLAQQNISGSSAPALKSTVSQKIPGSFCCRMVFRSEIWKLHVRLPVHLHQNTRVHTPANSNPTPQGSFHLPLCMLMRSPTARSLNCIILDNALSLHYPVYVSICQYNQADWSPVLGLTLSPPCWGAQVSRELLKRARLKRYQSIKKML